MNREKLINHDENAPDNINEIVENGLKEEEALVKSLLHKDEHKASSENLEEEIQAPSDVGELLEKAIENDGKVARNLLKRKKPHHIESDDNERPHPENFIG